MTQNRNKAAPFGESKLLEGRYHTVAVATSQGRRPYMQDVFAIILQHDMDPECDIFGMFDGHGFDGERAAHYIGHKLGDMVVERLLDSDQRNVINIIKKAFLDLDAQMKNDADMKDEHGVVHGGTTAVCVWAKRRQLVVAHVGDSRALISVGGKAVSLTVDHKPSDYIESDRIYKAGSHVYLNRVRGELAVSRAFGDFEFKKNPRLTAEEQMVIAMPDVSIVKTDDRMEFLILATDGVFDVLTNQGVVDNIKRMLLEETPLEEIAQDIVERCIGPPVYDLDGQQMYGTDNVSIIIAVPVRNPSPSDNKK